jgi:hypothetical protein
MLEKAISFLLPPWKEKKISSPRGPSPFFSSGLNEGWRIRFRALTASRHQPPSILLVWFSNDCLDFNLLWHTEHS